MLITELLSNPITFVLWVAAVIVAITFHEFSHALAGKLQGDSTAEQLGRLNLNPLRHIDWLGFFLLVIVGFGWAKPTPFNPYNLKYKKWGPALVAIAGPLSNFIIVAVIGTLLHLLWRFTGLDASNLMILFFINLIQINVLLGVFNLIPIPPLDGSKILYTIVGFNTPIVAFLEQYGTWILLAFVFFGGNILNGLFSFFYGLTLQLIF